MLAVQVRSKVPSTENFARDGLGRPARRTAREQEEGRKGQVAAARARVSAHAPNADTGPAPDLRVLWSFAEKEPAGGGCSRRT